MQLDLPTVPVTRRLIKPRDYRYRSAAEGDCPQHVTSPGIFTEHGRVMLVTVDLKAIGVDLQPMVELLKEVQFDDHRRTSGLPSTSRVFGFEPRRALRKDFCGTTSLASAHPAAHAALVKAASICEDAYKLTNPSLYAQHVEITRNKVLATWHLNNGVFTSGIVNKNNPLPYHYDTGNFASVWSAMLVFKGPGLTGGHLAVPQYDRCFTLPDHTLFMFDGQGLMHGVTPIAAPPGSYRYSVVFYSLRMMWACLPPEQELARIRTVKTQRERRRGGLA